VLPKLASPDSQRTEINAAHQCPPYATSVMMVDYFTVPTSDVFNCSWGYIPIIYDLAEFSMMRLR
jgi:hypothetical protein